MSEHKIKMMKLMEKIHKKKQALKKVVPRNYFVVNWLSICC